MKFFDPSIPYLKVGKCYNYCITNSEKKLVMQFYVSDVTPHRIIGTDEVCNYSYLCVFPTKDDGYHDSCLYIWNQVYGDRYYSVKFCSFEEMSEEDSRIFKNSFKRH